MNFVYVPNPFDFPCTNRQCSAAAGVACRTVGKFISASPHTPRLRTALAARPAGETPESTRFAAAIERYATSVMTELLQRAPTSDELKRAIKDGSLRPERGWLLQLVANARPTHRQPVKRVSGREVTLWGIVIHTEQLPSGSYLLALHTGELVRLPGAFWRDVWPERLKYRASLESQHPELSDGWWRFSIVDGECSAADEEANRPLELVRAPAPIDQKQLAMF